MLCHEPRRETARFGVHHIGYVALLPKLDGLGLVVRGVDISHPSEKIAQDLRVLVRELNEFKAVSASGIVLGDLCFRGVVGEWTHW